MAIPSNLLFVGTKGTVLALDRETGETRWETGRLYRLDPTTGAIQWCNELPGLGWNIVSIAGVSAAGAAAQKQRDAAAAAAAAAR